MEKYGEGAPCTLRIEDQLARLHIPVIVDSGSTRSLISFGHYQQLKLRNPQIWLVPTDVTCATASGQDLEVMGEFHVTLKIHGFSWRWGLFVSKKLKEVSILVADFIMKTKMVLDLANARIYFSFSPGK